MAAPKPQPKGRKAETAEDRADAKKGIKQSPAEERRDAAKRKGK